MGVRFPPPAPIKDNKMWFKKKLAPPIRFYDLVRRMASTTFEECIPTQQPFTKCSCGTKLYSEAEAHFRFERPGLPILKVLIVGSQITYRDKKKDEWNYNLMDLQDSQAIAGSSPRRSTN